VNWQVMVNKGIEIGRLFCDGGRQMSMVELDRLMCSSHGGLRVRSNVPPLILQCRRIFVFSLSRFSLLSVSCFQLSAFTTESNYHNSTACIFVFVARWPSG